MQAQLCQPLKRNLNLSLWVENILYCTRTKKEISRWTKRLQTGGPDFIHHENSEAAASIPTKTWGPRHTQFPAICINRSGWCCPLHAPTCLLSSRIWHLCENYFHLFFRRIQHHTTHHTQRQAPRDGRGPLPYFLDQTWPDRQATVCQVGELRLLGSNEQHGGSMKDCSGSNLFHIIHSRFLKQLWVLLHPEDYTHTHIYNVAFPVCCIRKKVS